MNVRKIFIRCAGSWMCDTIYRKLLIMWYTGLITVRICGPSAAPLPPWLFPLGHSEGFDMHDQYTLSAEDEQMVIESHQHAAINRACYYISNSSSNCCHPKPYCLWQHIFSPYMAQSIAPTCFVKVAIVEETNQCTYACVHCISFCMIWSADTKPFGQVSSARFLNGHSQCNGQIYIFTSVP